MTRETIQARRDALAGQLRENQANIAKGNEQLAHLDREFHTLNGALQDCDHFLAEITKEENAAAAGPPKVRQFPRQGESSDMAEMCDEIARAEAREAMRETPEERAG